MAEGGGGGAAARWIASAVLPRFAPGAASPLKSLPDASLLEEGSLLFSTDSFVVSPREFPGGNIGKLAVWRIATHQNWNAKWLSDYVDNYLGGFEGQEENPDVGESDGDFDIQ